MRASDNPSGDVGRSGSLHRRWGPNLFLQFGRVLFTRRHQLAPPHLSTDGLLQEFRSWQTAVLHHLVKVVVQVDLHSRHTPKYTHYDWAATHPGSTVTSRKGHWRRWSYLRRHNLAQGHCRQRWVLRHIGL